MTSTGALQVVEHDAQARRLVLRDRGMGAREVARRLGATLFAVLPLAATLTAHYVLFAPAWHLAWIVPLGLLLLVRTVRRARPQLEELGFDGQSGCVWTTERGVFVWGRRRRKRAVQDGLALAFQGGLHSSTVGGLGVVLELSSGEVSEPFTVEGVWRRSTLRTLVDHAAALLGLRVVVQRDDVQRMRLFCGAQGEHPDPGAQGGGSYRAAGPAALRLEGAAGFEPVTHPPAELDALSADAWAGLRETLEVDEHGRVVIQVPAPARSKLPRLVLGAYAALMAFVAMVWVTQPGTRPSALVVAGQVLASLGGIALAVGLLVGGFRIAEWALEWGTEARRWCLGDTWLTPVSALRRPLRATLDANGLTLLDRRGQAHVAQVEEVLLLVHELGSDWVALAVRVLVGGRWWHIAETQSVRADGATALATRRIGYEVAERCAAPLRSLVRVG